MRQITHSDVVVAACALRGMPRGRWPDALRVWLDRAHAADIYRKRLGRFHPSWGNGALGGAIPRPIPTEAPLSDPDQMEAMAFVIEALLAWRHSR
ncbi:hypothetical protein LV82_01357 [Albidovulum inexpectatum]|uniref:DUF7742 domain-containing protein n=1 Tax=Albidovulum inexpectatum TaxID=196587 RepID=A0A2S5JIV1_9RHOB|nr:hypothetical protein [Albidovulum inexpectatum]PPB81311.1 hypothetical protein LV82_01357 [Albidovulum inexpectatum]